MRIFAGYDLPNITELLGRSEADLQQGNIKIILNQSGEADLVLVLNTVRRPRWVRVPKGNLVKVLQEPTVRNPATHLFTYWHSRVYDRIFTHSPDVKDARQIRSLPYLNSWVDPELAIPRAETKQFQLSVIASTLALLPGHKLRVNFVNNLLARVPDLGPHTFGKGRRQELTNKRDGLQSYRFSVAIENSCISSYITEKFYDCIIAGCIPLYYGAPDIADYFPIDSYIPLPINDVEKCCQVISELSESDYLRRLPALIEARSLIREKYSLGALILNHFELSEDRLEVKRRFVLLFPLDALALFVWLSIVHPIHHRLYRFYTIVLRRLGVVHKKPTQITT